MSQTEVLSERKPWVLVSTLKESTSQEDLEKITPEISSIIDEWQSKGHIIWSGPFNDNKTGMAVFEATEDEANSLYDKYAKACSGVLDYFLYQWEAMPILSVLSKTH